MAVKRTTRGRRLLRILATLVVLVLAGAAALIVWQYYVTAPWTRDGRVRVPASAGLARGGRVGPRGRGEEVARQAFAGGALQIGPPTEEPAAQRPGRAARRSQKRKLDRAELQAARAASQPAHNRPASSGGTTTKGENGKAGRGQSDRQVCMSWNKGFGACGSLAAGAECPGGRIHRCLNCGSPSHKSKDCKEKPASSSG